MSTSPGTFDAALESWRAYQATPWGRLRYAHAEHHLCRHLADLGGTVLRVLDLAGADAGDAVPLARRGHHVTIVDYSPGMLAAGRERAARAGVADRVSTVEADVFALPAEVTRERYDVVLCHNLLQYQERLEGALGTASALVRPGGLLSVMAINRHSAPLALAVRGLDPAAAPAALGERHGHAVTFDAPLTLHTAEEATAAMTALGCREIRHYGIRTVSDLITEDARKEDAGFFAELEALELALAERDPFRQTARIFQLVGRVP